MNKLTALLLLAALAGCGRHEGRPPTPLMDAAARGDLARTRALLTAGADVNERRGVRAIPGIAVEGDNPIAGETALLVAIESNHLDIARALLAAGARLDVKDNWRQPVWYYLQRAIGSNRGAPMTRLVLAQKNLPAVDEYFLQARVTARRAGNDEVDYLLTEYVKSHQPGPCIGGTAEPQPLCGKQT
jgi:ankyrin repeat protein